MKSADALMLQVQLEQQKHDIKAHRDILNLDTQTRLKHMILHFLKYAGKMAGVRSASDKSALHSILLDAVIICLATANALNVKLGVTWGVTCDSFDELCNRLATQVAVADVADFSLMELVLIAGRMAKSIESTDHLERGDPRADLETDIDLLAKSMLVSVGHTTRALNAVGQAQQPPTTISILSSIRERWDRVEKKSIFFGNPF